MWTPPVENVDGSALVNLAGYRIYYGLDAESFDYVIDVGNPGLTAFTVEGLYAGTWYFAVAAYSSNDTQSSLSAVGSKTIQ